MNPGKNIEAGIKKLIVTVVVLSVAVIGLVIYAVTK